MNTVRETTFGVELHVGDRCFVIDKIIHERVAGYLTGTILDISDDGLVKVAIDDGAVKEVTAEYLTLSFALFDANETRRES